MTRGKGSDPFPRCILTNAPSVFPSPRIPNLHDTPSETPATPVWRSLPSFNPYHRAEPPGGENDRIGPNTAGPTGSGHGLFPRRRFMQRTGFQRNGIRRPGQPTDRKDRATPPVARIKNTAVQCTAVYLLGIWPIASRGDRDTRFFMQPNVGITATPQFAPTLPAPAVFLRKTLRPSMLRRQKGRSSGSSRFTSGAAGVCTGCCD